MPIFILYIFNIIFSMSFASLEGDKYLVQSDSILTVNGTTNINSFTCDIASYERNDTIEIFDSFGKDTKVSGTLNVAINKFDCHNPMMTKDLRKTLMCNTYPYLKIRFKSLSQPINKLQHNQEVMANVAITLAGKEVAYHMPFTYHYKNGSNVLLGLKTILFSDFNLTPPSKLGGAIKVRNELAVQVNLHLKKFS